ncbi:transcription elongation factor SPT4-like [Salvelinus alpinus]
MARLKTTPGGLQRTTLTIDQFEYDGCDNCESYLQMKGNREMVYECTSSSFDGVIAQMSPEDSWVAKWQRISNFKPGVYAVTVTGRLPPGIAVRVGVPSSRIPSRGSQRRLLG